MINALLTKSGLIERETALTSGPDQSSTTWGTVATAHCRVQQLSGTEVIQNHENEILTDRIFFLHGVDVQNQDRVTIDSKVYLVKFVDVDAGGIGHHVEAICKKVN